MHAPNVQVASHFRSFGTAQCAGLTKCATSLSMGHAHNDVVRLHWRARPEIASNTRVCSPSRSSVATAWGACLHHCSRHWARCLWASQAGSARETAAACSISGFRQSRCSLPLRSLRYVVPYAARCETGTAALGQVSRRPEPGFPHSTAPLAHHQLPSLFCSTSPCPQALPQYFPLLMILAACNRPIDDVPPAILPKSEGHQDHHLAACALLAQPLALVRRDLLLLADDCDPHAILLDDWGNGAERSHVRAPGQGFELIDPFLAWTQTNAAVSGGTPALLQLTRALAEAAAKQHVLIQIHPKPVVLFQNGEVVHPIVLALVTFDHRHTQLIQMSPACFPTPAAMTIPGEEVGIGASPGATRPINRTGFRTDPPTSPFFHPSLARTSASKTTSGSA